MNKYYLVAFFLIFGSCKSKVIKQDINDIYLRLKNGSSINYKVSDGQFKFEESNPEAGRYRARFINKSRNVSYEYLSHSSASEQDTMIFNGSSILLKSKFDPISIKVYEVDHSLKNYIVFIGNAQSTSGSGQQITFFLIVEEDKHEKALKNYEFNTRFGNINSLVDFNADSILDYFKIINGKNTGEYLLTVNEYDSDKKIVDGYVLLLYEFNDQFRILENKLPALIH